MLEPKYQDVWYAIGYASRSLKLALRRNLKSETIFGNWKPFKIEEKCFLFHILKTSKFLSWIFGLAEKRLD